MRFKHLLWCALFGLLGMYPAVAQDEIYISLNTESAAMQTGEVYEVQVVVENVADLWVTSFEIAFDPAVLYIIGTQAGSPVQPGPLLADKQLLTPRNRVERDSVAYTTSLLAPEEPVNGTGMLATFQVAPLRAGTTQLIFRQANLTAVAFEGQGEARRAGDPQLLNVTPVLLEIVAQGETVAPPPEVTATPQPTGTPILPEATEEAAPQAAPALANITRVPAEIPPTMPDPVSGESASGLSVVVGLLIVSGIGLLVLAAVYVRRYRR